MSNIEIINGVKYIDGYLCNDAGRPITVSNGYSSEEEKDAKEIYEDAKESASKNKFKKNKKVKVVNTENDLTR